MEKKEKDIVLKIQDLEKKIDSLPVGNVVYKTIKGNEQPYLQWYEDGKTKSKYIKVSERENVLRKIRERKALVEELTRLKHDLQGRYTEKNTGGKAKNNLPMDYIYSFQPYTYSFQPYPEAMFRESPFKSRVVIGRELDRLISDVDYPGKRDCYSKLKQYLYGRTKGKVCLLYGLRRTGKTTLLFQAIREMDLEDRKRAAYIKVRTSDNMGSLNYDLMLLSEQGYKYVFIDEVTLMEDFIDSAALLSDVFAMQGLKIVLSGTDSLGFWLSLTNELYDRAFVIHTTFIPFREYSRLLGINDIDEYIRFGGTLMKGEAAFDDADALAEDASFRDDESTRRYIDTAICNNIQHSLAYCKRGSYFRHLRELYEAGELTGAINRIIESMNHQFLISTLIEKFKSHDLGSAAEVLRKQRDKKKRTDILDLIDKEAITGKLMEMLEIRNIEDQKIGITKEHVAEIKEYLKALDLVVDCPSESLVAGHAPSEYVLFTQHGMRYSQAQALVHVLTNDESFASFSEREKKLACEKILEEVRGRMMEDIVLLETSRVFANDRKKKHAFKLLLERSEVDMVVYYEDEGVCELFEVKHSQEVIPQQYHVLADKEQCDLIEKRYGKITQKTVLYRGENKSIKTGIRYCNVEEYLKGIGNVM